MDQTDEACCAHRICVYVCVLGLCVALGRCVLGLCVALGRCVLGRHVLC